MTIGIMLDNLCMRGMQYWTGTDSKYNISIISLIKLFNYFQGPDVKSSNFIWGESLGKISPQQWTQRDVSFQSPNHTICTVCVPGWHLQWPQQWHPCQGGSGGPGHEALGQSWSSDPGGHASEPHLLAGEHVRGQCDPRAPHHPHQAGHDVPRLNGQSNPS